MLTERQKEYLDLYEQYGTYAEVAKEMGVNPSTVRKTISLAKLNIKKMKNKTEDGNDDIYSDVTRLTTLYDKDGDIRLQWVREDKRKKNLKESINLILSELNQEIVPYDPIDLPNVPSNDLLSLYVLTDYHLGMYSWKEETGEEWNIEKAKKLLVNWIDKSVTLSPDSETAVFCQLGDFLHYDGLLPVTNIHKHVLDTDTKFQNIVRSSIFLSRYIIDTLLKKHKYVHVIMADANHDTASSVWLRELFNLYYENEPRVTIDTNPDSYYCYVHGNVSLFFHHGHIRRPKNIDHIFASKFRKEYGESEFSYAHMGHLHFWDATETNLMVIEQHRTLSPKDSYSSRSGYTSGRDAKVITYHKKYGEVGRFSIVPEMFK